MTTISSNNDNFMFYIRDNFIFSIIMTVSCFLTVATLFSNNDNVMFYSSDFMFSNNDNIMFYNSDNIMFVF